MSKQKISAWEFFQNLGKTFMLPVALLAAMGILLGIGAGFSGPTTIQSFPFLGNKVLQLFFSFITQVSLVAFTFLPLLFAVAIPLGLTRENKEIAAFSGLVGYIAMQLGINFHLTSRNLIEVVDTKSILGIQSIDTGVLGGLICGIIVFFVHEKFKDKELIEAFSFFSGTRLVAIISAVVLSVIGLIIPFIWPYFALGINKIGYIIQKSGHFGPFLFGTGEVLLLPFGLHHILVAIVRFTEVGGSYINSAGEHIYGALNIFYNQFSQGHQFVTPEATQFLSQGKMPSLIFGLPGVAFAIYKTSFLENRKKIKGLLISAIIASAVGGITEPILFLFLFIAPVLYVFHAIMYGLGFAVMGMLKIMIGNTDGNLIDFIVFGLLQGTWTKWYLVIPVGIIWFFVYYLVFKWYIEKYNIQTPGRDNSKESQEILDKGGLNNYTAKLMLEGLGGKENLVSIDNCITRLRLTLNDASKIEIDKIKKAGAIDVVKLSDTNIQVIIGSKVQAMRKQIEKLL